MAKIKWETRKDKDAKKAEQEKFKGKDFKKLSTKEKDEILERIAQAMGII